MFSIRLTLGNHPRLFFPIYSLKRNNNRLSIKEDTELVVNAYPRCGNTYFYYAVKFLNPDLRIAHHLHVPALTLQALKKSKPIILIIREPSKAIASLLTRENHLTINQAFNLYLSFHQIALENSLDIMILNFEQVIGDFKEVISRINKRFSLNLNNYSEFTEKEKNEIFMSIEKIDEKTNAEKRLSENTVSRPSVDSNTNERKKHFQNKAKAHPKYDLCLDLYNKLHELAIRPEN